MVSSRGEPVIDSQRGVSLTPLHLGARTTGAAGIAGLVGGPWLTAAAAEGQDPGRLGAAAADAVPRHAVR